MIPSWLSNQSLLVPLWEKRDQNTSRSVLVIGEVYEKYNPTTRKYGWAHTTFTLRFPLSMLHL